jgi:uncharacterized protein HemX
MKIHPTLPILAVLALAWCGLAFAQAQEPTPTERLVALEKQIRALEGEVAKLQTRLGPPTKGPDLGDTRVLVEELVSYVNAQAKGAQQLAAVLAQSEEKGFTAGINSNSRIVLLEGMNSFVDSLQRNVPKLPAKVPAGSGQGR